LFLRLRKRLAKLLKKQRTGGRLMDWRSAKVIADKVVSDLRPYCKRIETAGSIRRLRSEVKDIEIVYIPKLACLIDLANCFAGWSRLKGKPTGRYMQFLLPEGIKLDLFQANEKNWGLIYAIRTGSARFSRDILAKGWVKKGYSSEHGILYPIEMACEGELDYKHPVYIKEEKDLFDFIGLAWVEPKERE
jgi:DNA polymerase/3'-5' exonuclease PolX